MRRLHLVQPAAADLPGESGKLPPDPARLGGLLRATGQPDPQPVSSGY